MGIVFWVLLDNENADGVDSVLGANAGAEEVFKKSNIFSAAR